MYDIILVVNVDVMLLMSMCRSGQTFRLVTSRASCRSTCQIRLIGSHFSTKVFVIPDYRQFRLRYDMIR